MLKFVDLSPGNITIKKAYAESIPYDDNYFDVATAYSFLDHLSSPVEVLQEAYRVLNEGGVFYSDLNPNYAFNDMLHKLDGQDNELTHILRKEIIGALHNGEYYQKEFGVNDELLTLAEPQKSFLKGFSALEIVNIAKNIGYTTITIEPTWFLGEATFDIETRKIIDNYLQTILPASDSLYKYLRFIFMK